MSWWRWFCEALFPARCIICKREGNWFCAKHNKFPDAPRDETDIKNLDNIFAATAYYDPVVRKAIEFFKFRGFADLADEFGEVIMEKCPAGFLKDAVIVPVPLHWSRRWWRGFNQADKIAEALARRNPGARICRDLKRIRRTKQQAKLNKSERGDNLEKAFVWQSDYVPQSVILIDDVVASGETLRAAAVALREAGVKNVSGVVFARGGKPCENLNNEN